MNKNLKLILTLITVLCMFFAVSAIAETTQCEEHTWDAEETVLREGTCTVKGVYKKICTDCSAYEYVTRYMHPWNDAVVTEATCTSPAKSVKLCPTCGATEETVVEGSIALGHFWDEEYVDASCASAAGLKKTCLICDAVEYEPYGEDHELYAPQLAHTLETINIAATCQETGISGKVVCTVCNTVTKAGSVLPVDTKNGHIADMSEEKLEILRAATCTTQGVAKASCKLCEKSVGYITLPAAHDWTVDYIDGKVETCGATGLANRTCNKCNTKEENVVIPATGDHVFENQLQLADCTKPGVDGEICVLCGAIGKNAVVYEQALGHDWLELNREEASCEKGAGTKYICSRGCGEELFVEFEADHPLYEAAKGHAYVVTLKAQAASCVVPGWTEEKVCLTCSDKIESKTIEADGKTHNVVLVEPAVRPATCTSTGVSKTECADCEKSLSYVVTPAAHSWVDSAPTVAATCGKDGKYDRYCTECKTTEKDVVIPATGEHAWISGEEPLDLCTDPIVDGMICMVCDKLADNAKIIAEAAGHTYLETYTAATCEKAAGNALVCSVCGNEDFEEFEVGHVAYEAPLGHDIIVDVAAQPASCTYPGSTALEHCTRCNYESEPETINPVADAHVVKEEAIRPATCTAAGVGKKFCEDCGKSLGYTTIPAAHAWKNTYVIVGDEVQAEDCGNDGLVNRECEACGAEEYNVVIPANGEHVWAEMELPADCTTPAVKGAMCVVCSKISETAQYVGEATGHIYGEEVLKDATCVRAAGFEKICVICEEIEFEAFEETNPAYEAPLGHFEEILEAVPATCSSTGLTEGKQCKTCGEILVEQELVAKIATAHKAKLDEENPVRAMNCKTNTNGVYKQYCELCGASMGYVTVTAAHEWTEVYQNEKEPTCVKEGVADRYCNNCDAVEYDVVVPATGEHEWVDGSVTPDCDTPAVKGKVCSDCGKLADNAKVLAPALGHVYDEIYMDATCDKAAGNLLVCSYCGYEDYEEFEEGHVAYAPAKGHVFQIIKGTPATCSAEGSADIKDCVNCDHFEGGEILRKDANVHTEEETVVRAETCTSNGVYKVTCAGCQKSLGYKTKPADHVWASTPIKNATCGEAGLEDRYCPLCEAVEYDVVVPATGEHNWSLASEKATCEVPGVRGMICSVCEQLREDAVVVEEALGHDYDEAAYVEPTCELAASNELICSECGDITYEELTESDEAYKPATGHTYVELVPAEKATCTTKGKTAIQVCINCEDEIGGEPVAIDPNAHEIRVVKEVRAKTCTTSGVQQQACSLCAKNLGYVVIPAGHNWDEVEFPEENNKSATCVEDGITARICLDCQTVEKDIVVPATGVHDWSELGVVPATCTEPEFMGIVCTECGATSGNITVLAPANGHKIVEAFMEADCENNAGVLYTCENCDYEEFEAYPVGHELYEAAVGHYYEVIEAVPATCKATGWTEQKVCINVFNGVACDHKADAGKEIPVDANAHTADPAIAQPVRAKTCTTAGLVKNTCKDCGKSMGYTTIPAGHEWDPTPLNITKEATCTEEGMIDRICTVCFEVEEDVVVEKEDHFWLEWAEYPATCTSPAYAGIKCVFCDATKGTIKYTGDALDHVLETKHVFADCENNAYELIECLLCDYEVKSEYPVGHDLYEKATNHPNAIEDTEEEVEELKATCVSVGYTKGVYCPDCEKYISGHEKVAIDPNNHKNVVEGDIVKVATCKVAGARKYECLDCRKSYVASYTVAHTWLAPEISEDGTYIFQECEVCGTTETLEVLVKEPCEHKNIETLEAVEATCTEDGLTEGKTCKDCGECLVAQDIVKAAGHKEEVLAKVEATCNKAGLTEGKQCTVCGEITVKQEEIPAAGVAHKEEAVEAVEATCTEDGATAGTKCSVCGEVVTGCEVVKALGHTNVVVAAKAATCTEAGYTESISCSVCGEVVQKAEEIKALGHTAVTEAGKDATCTEAGYTEFSKCSECGEVLTEKTEVAAKGHKWNAGSWAFNEDGTKKVHTRECTACGATTSEEYDL